jgi:hypothetical protein
MDSLDMLIRQTQLADQIVFVNSSILWSSIFLCIQARSSI